MGEKARLPATVVPKEALDTFAAVAKREGKSLSGALREALSEYLERRGVEVDFEVGSWGGKRDKDTDDTDEEELTPQERADLEEALGDALRSDGTIDTQRLLELSEPFDLDAWQRQLADE
jgi:hypothetical protein